MLQRWVLPHFMCNFCPFVKILSISVSVFTLCAIALDRCMAILYPLTCRARFSRLHFRVISIIWICGLLLASPMLYVLHVTPHEFFYGEWFCTTRKEFEPWMHYLHLTQVLFLYFLPFLVISVAYAIMGHTLWGATAPGNAQSERDSNILRNKKKVIKMLSIVVVLFGLCWLPLQIYNAIQDITDINEFRYINILWFGMDWLAMSNSCYNPFIYAIYNEKFKREFQLRLRAPCLKKRKRGRPLKRELSGFESSRFDWKRSTMENGKTSVITLH
ncbi:hypothetical protein GE061_019759 [Apolygus lucorum]|uniref:G-protein coupled receptors family 1 profile domain-containing protein n=1 Tax=Apolygus lucorum TaxID=248454 RepID=A0A6A4JTK5_APOLU|nr:hypothetical protein GE061_019759 [Apolygus lucorum]